ncbi:MAG: biopolymer transporter ExbD [Betaproteobacteria bacterium]|nr:biopolymer transporter ExbD [Betaproteobacteria bacterium]
MKLRRLRQHKKGRIEIIPMIDVMFFLLATFMLASLSMQSLNSLAVNLPQGEASPMQVKTPVTLTVRAGGEIFLNQTPVTLDRLAATLRPMLQAASATVIVAADEVAPQGIVVKAMLQARAAGAEHFLLAVKRGD